MGNQITTPANDVVQNYTQRALFAKYIQRAMRVESDGGAPTTDMFGFPLEPSGVEVTQDVDEQEAFSTDKKREERAEKEKTRIAKWAQMCTEQREMKLPLQLHEKFRERLLKGMPALVRGYVWSELLEIREIKERYEKAGIQEHTFDRKMHSYYECLVKHATEHPNEYNGPRGYIERDLQRTFPRHPLFAQEGPDQSVALEKLRKVLIAYSAHHDQIGYTQGMNYIAAMLLGFLPEEQAFWAFIGIMENVPKPADEAVNARHARRKGKQKAKAHAGGGTKVPPFVRPTYSFEDVMRQGLPLAQKNIWCLDRLLEQRLPKIHAHLAACDVRAEMYSLSWIVTLFIRDSPLTFAVRVWDMFLAYGWSTFFSIALAIIYKARKRLKAAKDFEKVIEAMKEVVKLFKREKIIKYAFATDSTPNLLVTREDLAAVSDAYLQSPEFQQRQAAMEREAANRKKWAAEDAAEAAAKAATPKKEPQASTASSTSDHPESKTRRESSASGEAKLNRTPSSSRRGSRKPHHVEEATALPRSTNDGSASRTEEEMDTLIYQANATSSESSRLERKVSSSSEKSSSKGRGHRRGRAAGRDAAGRPRSESKTKAKDPRKEYDVLQPVAGLAKSSTGRYVKVQ